MRHLLLHTVCWFALLSCELFHTKRPFLLKKELGPNVGTPKLHFRFVTSFKYHHDFLPTTFQHDYLNLSKSWTHSSWMSWNLEMLVEWGAPAHGCLCRGRMWITPANTHIRTHTGTPLQLETNFFHCFTCDPSISIVTGLTQFCKFCSLS